MNMQAMSKEAFVLIQRFKVNWKNFLAIHIAVSALVFALLTPLAGLLLQLAIDLSGSAALSDQDILFFALSPFGFVSALILGSIFSIIVFLGHGALVVVAASIDEGGASSVRAVLAYLAGRMSSLFKLALHVLIRVLLNLLPFILLALLIYDWLLSEFDINYYLTEKPNEWWLAISLGGIVAVACALNLLRLFINWVFCLPVLLLEGRSPKQALAESANTGKGHRLVIGKWLLAWLALSMLLTVIVSGLVALTGMLMIPSVATSIPALIAALGFVSLVSFLLFYVVSFASSSLLALLIVGLFSGLGLKKDFRPDDVVDPDTRHSLLADRRTLTLGLVIGLVAAVLIVWIQVSRLQFEHTAEVMAHRGASAAAPENTIAAIQGAIDAGAQWVEIDVQESADGHVVVIHDSDLKKVGGSPLTVAGSTLEQLQAVDIGSWFSEEFSEQRVPTLQQVLELCKDRINVIIELKYYGKQVRLEERVAEVVEDARMSDQVMVMSLSYDGIQVMRRVRPGWKVGLLSSVALGNLANLDVDFLALNGRAATRHMIRRAHERGKQVMVWTVNDAISMSSMIGRGADGLITDEPALAAEILEKYADLEPSQRLLLQMADLFDRPGLYKDQ